MTHSKESGPSREQKIEILKQFVAGKLTKQQLREQFANSKFKSEETGEVLTSEQITETSKKVYQNGINVLIYRFNEYGEECTGLVSCEQGVTG